MTFNGPTRADKETIAHSHESPMVMLVPLFVLGLGAIAAGFIFAPYFIGHEEALFWGSAIYRGEENHIIHEIHEVPKWVKYSPLVAMVWVASCWRSCSTFATRHCPAKLGRHAPTSLSIPAQQVVH